MKDQKKKKKTRWAENPKGRSRQKLGPKKRKRRKEKIGNLKMQLKKRIILQDESLEVWFKRNEHKNDS